MNQTKTPEPNENWSLEQQFFWTQTKLQIESCQDIEQLKSLTLDLLKLHLEYKNTVQKLWKGA